MAQNRRFSWIAVAITFAVLYGTYLLFVSTLTKPELLAGVGVAALATFASGAFGTIGIVHFRPTLRHLLQAWRIPRQIVEGTSAVLIALAKQLLTKPGAPSLLVAAPFDVGPNDAGAAARRALAITYTTMTPNSVVLGIAHHQGLLLYHQMLPAKVSQMTINLGALP